MMEKKELILINNQTTDKDTWKKGKQRFDNTYSEENFNYEEYDNKLCKIIESACLLIKTSGESETFYSFIEFSKTASLKNIENEREEGGLEMLLKIKVLEETRRVLASKLSFGDFFYLNIKHISSINFFVDKKSNEETHELNVKMEVLIAARLLLGHKQLFLASLNTSISESLKASVNFESIELSLINYKNAETNNLLINKGCIWKDKLWSNHLFHMFCPSIEFIPKLSHYKNTFKRSSNFIDIYDDLTCTIFFFFTEKVEKKTIYISISKKEDFRYESLSTLFVRGFSDTCYLSNLALINLIRLYCYENKIVVSTLNQPALIDIMYDTFGSKITKSNNVSMEDYSTESYGKSVEKEKQIVYLQDLQKLLEHVIHSIRIEYPEKFPNQITIIRLEELIEQYSNLAIRTIIANPLMYLPFETE